MDFDKRVARLQQVIQERKLDAMLVTDAANRVYLSGFGNADTATAGSVGWLLIGPTRGAFITNFLYLEAVKQQVKHLEVVNAPVRISETLKEIIEGWGIGKLGFESNSLTVSQHQALTEATPAVKFEPADGIVEEFRQVKNETELGRIRTSLELTDRAYNHVMGVLRPGLTEKEVAWEIERYLREHGAESMAFAPAVAAGPNSAVPHHEPSDRPIEVSEPIWLDFGARLNGYCADLTRTICLGEPPAQLVKVVDAVQKALEVAESQIKAGLTGKQADAIARDLLAQAGFGDAFTHSLGHGLGLYIHEGPRLSRFYEDELKAGAVVTIEPGVYLPGWGGVRIEDTVVVREDGVEILTTASKDWRL